MTFIVSHPTGNTFVKALLEELQHRNLLAYFSTTIGFGENFCEIFSKFKSRRLYNIPDAKIERLWYPELMRLLQKGGQEKKRKFVDQTYAKLDQKTSKKIEVKSGKVIHAYEDGAYQSFIKAKKLGIQCSYELPIAHWATSRRLLAEEAERYPLWEPTLETTREPEEKLFQKEEELRLADRITCPSQFVLDSIPTEIRNCTPSQIAPFGSPPRSLDISFLEKKKNEAFKILFVGSMSQRKGLADLFEAMKLLKKEAVTLSILGQPSMPMEFYRKQLPNFEYYKPCANSQVKKIMQQHDALVLPSIVEGRALVQQEALACGLPIIVTPNAGGEDLIEDGVTGYLVPIRSPRDIAEKIMTLLTHKCSRIDISHKCSEKASDYSWAVYARKIIDFNLDIQKIFE
ncbi:MAG: glycosyltransferase family 4 protein [Opitutae bacterium]